MNRRYKLAAVTISASLLLFGCSAGSGTSAGSGKPAFGSGTAEGDTAGKAAAGSGSEDGTAADTGTLEGTDDMKNTAVDIAGLTLNDNIHINQLGYRKKDPKPIIVNGKAGQFAVVEKSGGRQVFSGKLKKGVFDPAGGDDLYYGDFSKLEEAGTYIIAVPGIGISGEFSIGDSIYGDLKKALLKAFYYQRCGMDLEEKYAGVWAHAACHTAKGKVFGQEGVELDGNGGWHDAGDYGKYTVAAATALADLMMAWELFPGGFDDRVDIPESGNGIPDILDEVRYELEWLLKMQDKNTGGVYHKLTSSTFPSLALMPQDDMSKLYFSPVSGTATGDFAAVAAMASRIFAAYDAGFSQTCLGASEKAWRWLEDNRGTEGFKNPGDISTGEYGDGDDSDERFWAAAELYRATGGPVYGDYVKSVCKKTGTGGFSFGWQSVGGFAGAAYLHMEKDKQDQSVYDYLKKELIRAAEEKLSKSSRTGYRITLGENDYIWGSNMILMNDARVLILADRMEPSKGYRNTAKRNLDYLLGSNPLNQCYVTGFGTKTVLDPHHRPSKADDAEPPVPGLVAGGPNAGLQDDIAKINLKGRAPARCYIDYSGSYSTNEVTIYWNSPALLVAACFAEE